MLAEVETWPDIILALSALITACAGFIAGYAALKRTRESTAKTAEEDCLERLRDARDESERVAKELHDRRMREHLG